MKVISTRVLEPDEVERQLALRGIKRDSINWAAGTATLFDTGRIDANGQPEYELQISLRVVPIAYAQMIECTVEFAR